MTCHLPPKHRGPGRLNPWRKMTADDLGLSLLVGEYDPELLRVGIKAPRVDMNKMRGKNHMWFAHQVASRKGASEQQRLRARMRNTVDEKIVKQEIASILLRYQRLGEVRR